MPSAKGQRISRNRIVLILQSSGCKLAVESQTKLHYSQLCLETTSRIFTFIISRNMTRNLLQVNNRKRRSCQVLQKTNAPPVQITKRSKPKCKLLTTASELFRVSQNNLWRLLALTVFERLASAWIWYKKLMFWQYLFGKPRYTTKATSHYVPSNPSRSHRGPFSHRPMYGYLFMCCWWACCTDSNHRSMPVLPPYCLGGPPSWELYH